MRAVTKETVRAFFDRRERKIGNSQVIVYEDRVRYLLHGNCIAELQGNNLRISNAGWATPTTKERLNGLLETFGACIYQKSYQWYLCLRGEEMPMQDGTWYWIE